MFRRPNIRSHPYFNQQSISHQMISSRFSYPQYQIGMSNTNWGPFPQQTMTPVCNKSSLDPVDPEEFQNIQPIFDWHPHETSPLTMPTNQVADNESKELLTGFLKHIVDNFNSKNNEYKIIGGEIYGHFIFKVNCLIFFFNLICFF